MNRALHQLGIAIFLTLCISTSVVCQEIVENIEELGEQDGRREEIQRYFGYEDLLFRFTTLPYDVTQNTNQVGRFVDIGYPLLSILPIIVLGLCFKRRKAFYFIMSFLLFYLASCFLYSYVLTKGGYIDLEDLRLNESAGFDIIDHTLSALYKLSGFVMSGLLEGINRTMESVSYVVYFLLFTLFITILGAFKNYSLVKTIWIIFLSYSFLWLILSGGILWYGFMFLPIGMILIFKGMQSLPEISIGIKRIVLTIIILWLGLSSISRISYLDYRNNEGEHAGKSIIHGNLFAYAMGVYDDRETLNFTSPHLTTALDRINSNNDNIYMIGTSYSFNIKNNIERIFQDNLLTNYTKLIDRYEEKDFLIEALKASNFRYIVVDLHTPSLDNTPEQSLTQKFRLLLNSLYQNPNVSLIATDRVVEFIDSNGNNQKISNVFGDNLVNFGSYAVYEIL